MKFYIAYGSNMNVAQMTRRCPDAKMIGVGVVKGWRLVFRGVADIVQDERAEVPVLVWSITRECEQSLDIYEGYPHLYTKTTLLADLGGGRHIGGMAYVMQGGELCPPGAGYLNCIRQGYEQAEVDTPPLIKATTEAINAYLATGFLKATEAE